jgi:membrane fusion protein, multidrug efflux system
LIPSSTIQHNGEEAFVYVIANGTAHVRDVKTGTTDDGMTAVEGVNPGDVIATSSFEKLQNGSKVNVVQQVPGVRSQQQQSQQQQPGASQGAK